MRNGKVRGAVRGGYRFRARLGPPGATPLPPHPGRENWPPIEPLVKRPRAFAQKYQDHQFSENEQTPSLVAE
jgi:hypothetical protein